MARTHARMVGPVQCLLHAGSLGKPGLAVRLSPLSRPIYPETRNALTLHELLSVVWECSQENNVSKRRGSNFVFRHDLADDVEEVVEVDGLGEEVCFAGADDDVGDDLRVALAGHEDDARLGVLLADPLYEVEPVGLVVPPP